MRLERDISNRIVSWIGPETDKMVLKICTAGRASQGFSGLRAIYFQVFGENCHLFSGIRGESITFWGFREQGAAG